MKSPQEDTKLVADPKRVKMVRIRAKRDVLLSTGAMLLVGKEAEVSEEEAEQLSKIHEGTFNFGGERDTVEATRHQIQRVERIA